MIKHTSVFMGLDYCIHFWIEYHVSWSMVTDWESKAIQVFCCVTPGVDLGSERKKAPESLGNTRKLYANLTP